MQIKGIKRGNVIELLEEVAIPDDTEILIEVQETSPMSDEERWEKMKAFLESDRPGRKELVKILNEIDRENNPHEIK